MRVAERAERGARAPAREFPILFEDEHLLAIDKPAGVAVHGGSGVSFGVIEQLRQARPQARFLELVHRLDKRDLRRAAAGQEAQRADRAAGPVPRARDRQDLRRAGDRRLAGAQKVIDVALHKSTCRPMASGACARSDADDDDGRRSITLVKVARRCQAFTLLDVTIKTGRTHQIRVHLAHAGHAIVGDDKYGDFDLQQGAGARRGSGGLRFDRMFLHARRLAFEHPASGERIELRGAAAGRMRQTAGRAVRAPLTVAHDA